MNACYLDANVIIRLLTGKPEDQAEFAADFLNPVESGDYEVIVTAMIVAEVVFVLSGKIYNVPRDIIAEQLQQFLSNPALSVPEAFVLFEGLNLFSATKLDFVDCYLVALAKNSQRYVVTFDRAISRLSGVNVKLLNGMRI